MTLFTNILKMVDKSDSDTTGWIKTGQISFDIGDKRFTAILDHDFPSGYKGNLGDFRPGDMGVTIQRLTENRNGANVEVEVTEVIRAEVERIVYDLARENNEDK